MMKREGSVRTLEIIKECADTAGECTISLEQAEKAMEIEQLSLLFLSFLNFNSSGAS